MNQDEVHENGPPMQPAAIDFSPLSIPARCGSKKVDEERRRSDVTLLMRFLGAAALSALAIVTPEIFATVQPSGVSRADVCASAGRRVSVSGCANIADTVAQWVPPPSEYAPLPEDYPPPPPPPPPPNVNVCASVGRRVSVSGCV
jgi:hypothetical protein